ncbi:MAG: pheromone autoinducer 2 transporter [Bacteroidetes bacterium]|nr:pheromone autoinducer 2 transporter [Bacteroidota bacterium]
MDILSGKRKLISIFCHVPAILIFSIFTRNFQALKLRTYLIPILSILAIIAFVWIFTKVVIYLLIASVLTLICQPLVKLYSRIKINKFHLPDSVVSLLTIATVISSVIFMTMLFAPVLIKEVKFLSTLNFNDVFNDILSQFPQVKALLLNFGTEQEISAAVTSQVNDTLNVKNISTLLNDVLDIASSLLGGTLAVLFITFFLIKENKMAFKSLILITPSAYETEIIDILRTTKSLLSKYFVGLFIDVVIVSVLATVSMLLLGVRNAVLIGVFTGLMNIIPYLGPLISGVFAIFLGVTGCIEYGQMEEISAVITKIFFTLLAINLLDGFFIQPYIFSNTVKAHPLEIFLVILMAASVAGIWGMVVAIPTYTLLRIIAKEFLVNFKFFKKITENIPE